jgi:chromosome partitioning protein
MIIAFLNQKGGVGKTTLATQVAGELAARDFEVVVVDADPQGSALDWSQRRHQKGLLRKFGVIGLARETLHVEVPQLARGFDHVIIDGPPRATALTRSAMLAADVIIIPVQPSPYDVWASAEIVSLVREACVFRPALRATFVINRRITGTVIGREARPALTGHPYPILATEVHQRVAFADSATAGRLVREYCADSPATVEVRRLASEVIQMETEVPLCRRVP